MIIIDWLNENTGVLGAVTIFIAVIVFVVGRIIHARATYRNRINLLEAIKKELEWNMQWVKDVVEDENIDIPYYYDPTRANFKCGSDIITYGITVGQSFLRSKVDLVRILVGANDAIRYYNQQVQEQHDCRFGSPEIIGKATRLYRQNPDILKQWMCSPDKRGDLIDFLEELRSRNWAINRGKKYRLRPALMDALTLINSEIAGLKRSKKWWHFWKG